MAEALQELRAIRAAFSRGEQTFTKVRALTRVATASSEEGLLELAEALTQPLNSSMKNAAWKSKQKEFVKHSKLLRNGRLIDECADAFDEAAIDARGAWLADRIVSIWPGPDSWDENV